MSLNYNALDDGSITMSRNDVGKLHGKLSGRFLRSVSPSWFVPLLLLLILSFSGGDALAQVTAGFGNTTNSAGPWSSCWGYSYHQMIYTQATVNAAAAGNITSVSFTSAPTIPTTATGGTPNTPQGANTAFRIYMGHTAKTSFTSNTDWIPLGSMTLVFDGTVTMPATAGDVVTINLTTPFPYNNTDNLVIAFDENSPGFSCTYTWVANSGQTQRNIYFRSDSTNPDPTTPPSGTRVDTTPQFILGGLTPGCSVPLNPVGTPTSTTTATVAWSATTPAPASGYEWEVRTSGAGGSGNPGLAASGSTPSTANTTSRKTAITSDARIR